MNAATDSSAFRPPLPQLIVRFVLELSLLAAYAVWGWRTGDGGAAGLLLSVLFPATAAAFWGVFGAENDPSRGRPVVVVPGWTRLLIEGIVIVLGAIGVWTTWSRAVAETLLTVFVLHYALIWERNWRLLRPNKKV